MDTGAAITPARQVLGGDESEVVIDGFLERSTLDGVSVERHGGACVLRPSGKIHNN